MPMLQMNKTFWANSGSDHTYRETYVTHDPCARPLPSSDWPHGLTADVSLAAPCGMARAAPPLVRSRLRASPPSRRATSRPAAAAAASAPHVRLPHPAYRTAPSSAHGAVCSVCAAAQSGGLAKSVSRAAARPGLAGAGVTGRAWVPAVAPPPGPAKHFTTTNNQVQQGDAMARMATSVPPRITHQ